MLLCLFMVCTVVNTNVAAKETHIYDKAKVKAVWNGSHDKKIGKYSIVKVDSEKCTEENLEDWYFNYVDKHNYNWCMIIYTDKDDNSGVYANVGMVEVGVIFEKDKYGDYYLGSSENSTMYTADDTDNSLLTDEELQARYGN